MLDVFDDGVDPVGSEVLAFQPDRVVGVGVGVECGFFAPVVDAAFDADVDAGEIGEYLDEGGALGVGVVEVAVADLVEPAVDVVKKGLVAGWTGDVLYSGDWLVQVDLHR